jgi:membrane protein implicated in regulation of membrane protease activity
MDYLFLACAIFGGTVLVAQFLLGLGGDEDLDDGAEDTPDHVEAFHDGDSSHTDHHHGSTWLFGVLSFRTVMIGLTFFGLTGKATSASGFAEPIPVGVAIGCGLAAMYGVYFLMRGLYQLTADGTERIASAVGQEATVYLTIPAQHTGKGKIHVPVQNRLLEYEAETCGEKLPTGTRVVVVAVLGPACLEVEPIFETASQSHA